MRNIIIYDKLFNDYNKDNLIFIFKERSILIFHFFYFIIKSLINYISKFKEELNGTI